MRTGVGFQMSCFKSEPQVTSDYCGPLSHRRELPNIQMPANRDSDSESRSITAAGSGGHNPLPGPASPGAGRPLPGVSESAVPDQWRSSKCSVLASVSVAKMLCARKMLCACFCVSGRSEAVGSGGGQPPLPRPVECPKA